MRNDDNQIEYKFHKVIEAQLHLLDLPALKEVLKLATKLACPEPKEAPRIGNRIPKTDHHEI